MGAECNFIDGSLKNVEMSGREASESASAVT